MLTVKLNLLLYPCLGPTVQYVKFALFTKLLFKYNYQ